MKKLSRNLTSDAIGSVAGAVIGTRSPELRLSFGIRIIIILYKRKRRRINIRDKMRNILHFVKKNPKKKAEIRSFMKDKNNRYELAVTFSSVLELEKAKKIAADQDENFAPIYVYGKEERG